MGLFRILFTYLMRNEQLINKLADSKPIRRSAQFIAYLLLRGRAHGLPFKRDDYIKHLENAKHTFKEKLQQVKDDIKKNASK
uniref:protein NCBP2AS2 homolog n=1 Tax=Osmia lignaria TaxID=473952 RepID=UPI001478C01A|nr:protein NCBP2AS2 homolog [Osmia lignaria]